MSERGPEDNPEAEPQDLKGWLDEKVVEEITSRASVPSSSVIKALRARYSHAAYTFFEQVRDSTGYGASRTADAMVMGLWPSRGLDLEGFEIKVSRNDWLRELKDPSKAEAICCYCDRWWVVVSDDTIVKPEELPKTWGLLVLRKTKLVQKVAAPQLTPKPIDRGFLASLLRKSTEDMILKSEINDKINQSYQQGVEHGKSRTGETILKHELDALKESLKDFQKASGIEINAWNGHRMGEVVKYLVERGTNGTIHSLKRYRDELKESLKHIEESLGKIEEETKDLPER